MYYLRRYRLSEYDDSFRTDLVSHDDREEGAWAHHSEDFNEQSFFLLFSSVRWIPLEKHSLTQLLPLDLFMDSYDVLS